MVNIPATFPDAEQLAALPIEDVAGALLQAHAAEPRTFLPGNEAKGLYSAQPNPYPPARKRELERIVMEAYGWLRAQALIAFDPWSDNWMFVTRRGHEAAKNFVGFRQASGLNRDTLVPSLAASVWPLFAVGQFDQAVFQAFKEVEIAVRAKGGFLPTDTGTALMRLAFNKKNGRLRDETRHEGESDALADLFAGAIGYSKNPHSHRHVGVEAQDAVEMIYLANHLLRIVESIPRE